jgi:hypothetical protein
MDCLDNVQEICHSLKTRGVKTFFANYSGFVSYLCKTPSNQAIDHHFFYCSPVVVYAPSLKVIIKEKSYR